MPKHCAAIFITLRKAFTALEIYYAGIILSSIMTIVSLAEEFCHTVLNLPGMCFGRIGTHLIGQGSMLPGNVTLYCSKS